jgi:micrococcal nuclease
MRKFTYYFALILLATLFSDGQSFGETWPIVKQVIDGDTILLSDGRYVRYIGINAPEIDYDKKRAEPFGYKAKSLNKRLVLGKKIRLELDKETHGPYGRLLAYVFSREGKFVNKELIGHGYAYVLFLKPNVKYNKLLLNFQRDAMSAKKGMWGNWKEKEDVYVGNRRSKRFHHKNCPFGKKIKKSNRKIFSRKWDAFWAGFAPSKRCLSVKNR